MKTRMKTCVHLLGWLASTSVVVTAQTQTAQVQVAFSQRLGPLEIGKMALGQGGLSDDPMWADRLAEVRALHPRVIRLFIQEYFNLLPKRWALSLRHAGPFR